MAYDQSFKGWFTFADAHCLEAGLDAFVAICSDSTVELDDLVIDGLRVSVDIDTYASAGMWEHASSALGELGSEAKSGSIRATLTVGRKDRELISCGQRSSSEGLPARHYRWELFFAAKRGDANRLRELAAQGVSLAQTYEGYKGWSLLHLAAKAGAAEAVALLLEAGVDPDVASSFGQTPLSLTASCEVARLLLAAGADLDRPVGDSVALVMAFRQEHDELGELLLELGAKLPESNRMAVVEACTRRGRIAALRCLAKLGPEVTALFAEPKLVEAAIARGPVVLDFLLGYGAQLPDNFLEQAVRAGSIELAEAALRLPGALERCGPSSGRDDAMCIAAGRADLAMMQLLARHGVPIHPDWPGKTSPLHMAATRPIDAAVECIDWLLDSGVPIDESNEAGDTALAWVGNSEKAATRLLERGADPAALSGLHSLHRASLRKELDEKWAALVPTGKSKKSAGKRFSYRSPAWLQPCELNDELARSPAVAVLATDPFLCAAICEWHRRGQASVPVTPDELCEQLCEMLLADAAAVFEDTGGALQRRLLNGLAERMVSSGTSVVTEAEVRELMARELDGTRSREVLRALVERVGILRGAAGGGFEFSHDSMKHQLAADAFIEEGAHELLASYAAQDAWQPVILSAAAKHRRAREFVTGLIQALLEQPGTSVPTGRAKQAHVALKYFVLRCCVVASSSDEPEILAACQGLFEQLTPPGNASQTAMLVDCGEAAVPYLEKRPRWRAKQRFASIHALGRIGGERARRCLESYADETVPFIIAELLRLPADLAPRLTSDQVTSLVFSEETVASLTPLAGLPNLTSLRLTGTKLADVSSLGSLSRLTTLELCDMKLTDLSAVESLSRLTKLEVRNCPVPDISVLARLLELTDLSLVHTGACDISPLAGLSKLSTLSLHEPQVVDVSPLAGLRALTQLRLGRTRVSDISPLAGLSALTDLRLEYTRVSDISPLAKLTTLTVLDLASTKVSDLSTLVMVPELVELDLSGTEVSDLSPLARLPALAELDLSGTEVSDLSPLARLPALAELDLSETNVSDLSPLATVSELTRLELTRTPVSDLSPLVGLDKLDHLDLRETKVVDLAGLESRPRLWILRDRARR